MHMTEVALVEDTEGRRKGVFPGSSGATVFGINGVSNMSRLSVLVYHQQILNNLRYPT